MEAPVSEIIEDPTEVAHPSDAEEEHVSTHSALDTSNASVVTLRNLLQHVDAHPVILGTYLLQLFGPSWLLWETESLLIHLRGVGHPTVSHTNLDKIQAVKALQTSDTPWQHWDVFNHCVHALTGEQPDFTTMQIPSVIQCAVGTDIIEKVRDDVSWGAEVKAFVGEVCRHDQILCPQAPIQWATITFEPEILDAQKVHAAFRQALVMGREPTEQTIEAEQVRRLLVVERTVRMFQRRYDEQCKLLTEA
jgi:hypothetical protein